MKSFRSLFGQRPSEEQMRSIDPDLIAEAFYAADAPNGAPIARALEVAKKTPEDEMARVCRGPRSHRAGLISPLREDLGSCYMRCELLQIWAIIVLIEQQ